MSGIATGTALAIGLGTAGSVASGVIGSRAAGSAAKTQSNAAVQGAQIQADQANKSLDFQKSVYGDTKANQAPFLKAGQQAVSQLSDLLAPGQPLSQQWMGQFQAPTAEQAAQTPGYQFTFNQGLQALDRGAAARGNLLTGGMMQREQEYGQGLASQTYQQTFNNALTQYQQAYNTFQNNQANQYNRLAGVAGVGQISANQLGASGQSAAGNVSNIYQNLGNSQASGINNAAAATASGYVGGANAWNNALGGIGSSATLAGLLYDQNQGGGGGTGGLGETLGIPNRPWCWVAAELYGGWNAPKTEIVREWMSRHPVALAIYRRIGPQLAELIKRNMPLRRIVKLALDKIVRTAWAA